jgi:phosphoribosylformylglycinamidine synthase
LLKAEVRVTLKTGVLDPQGEAVKRSLHVLGYDQVEELRIGKFIEVWLQGDDPASAQAALLAMSDQLLANPVIEAFRVDLVEATS